MAPLPGYALLDAGDRRRLERFGGRVLDRPSPASTALRRDPGLWGEADLRFDPVHGWNGRADAATSWTIEIDGLTLELRATESGGIGLFPEQLQNAEWLARSIRETRGGIGDDGDPPAVLNLFAHTGLLTLAAARAGAAVTHVDGARSAVAWARRNAEISNLAGAPIRWIVDDALAFARREARRGRRYAGIVLDPPTYGHGPRGAWQLESGLPVLLAACAAVATADPFVLLTAHTEGLEADWLVGQVSQAFGRQGREIEVVPLELEAATGGSLTLGTAIRTNADRRRWSR